MSDVVTLPGVKTDLPECPVQVDNSRSCYCRFRNVGIRLDTYERRVRCAGCGHAVDAFDYLVSEAQELRRAWQSHEQVRRELGELQERVTALKAEEKRLKARVKRAEERVEPARTFRGGTK